MIFASASAQNSAPAPGTGGKFTPNAPINLGSNPGIVTPPPGSGLAPNVPMWGTSNSMMNGGPWGPGAFSGPYNNNGPGFDYGQSRVIGVGYDVQDVWETVPMVINWHWNGFYYDVVVQSAWNPWTQMWESNLNVPAFQTDYTLRGVPYSFYVNLSTGTYYFNP